MFDTETLLPPLPAIHERLTYHQREQQRLRKLLRLVIEANDDRRRRQDVPGLSLASTIQEIHHVS